MTSPVAPWEAAIFDDEGEPISEWVPFDSQAGECTIPIRTPNDERRLAATARLRCQDDLAWTPMRIPLEVATGDYVTLILKMA